MHAIRSRIVGWLVMLLACAAAPTTFAQDLDIQLKPLVDEIISGCSQAGAKRITVADFADLQGQVTDFGRFIAEELGVSLVMSKPKFGLVDRANLRTILAEHKLSMSGLVNPDTAKKLGQIAGVDGIVTGTITPLGDSYRLTIKVISTETADVIAGARANIARTPAIEAVATNKRPPAGDSPTTGGLTPGSTGVHQGSAVKAAEGGFSFDLQSCKRLGSSVNCSILITNMAEQTDLSINPGNYRPYSRAFDDAGDEYPAEEVQLGSRRSGKLGDPNNTTVVAPGIPVRARFLFEGIASNVSRFTAVEIVARAGRVRREFRAQLLNVPIQ